MGIAEDIRKEKKERTREPGAPAGAKKFSKKREQL